MSQQPDDFARGAAAGAGKAHGDQARRPRLGMVELAELGRSIRIALVAIVGIALVGAIVDGLVNGLTFALLLRWAAGAVVALLLTTLVVAGVHAIGTGWRARRGGERLRGDDVGLMPPRRRR